MGGLSNITQSFTGSAGIQMEVFRLQGRAGSQFRQDTAGYELTDIPSSQGREFMGLLSFGLYHDGGIFTIR